MSSTVFVSGAAMEVELVHPERYKRGKERVSVLIVGFYCTKKFFASEGACFHVILPQTNVISDNTIVGYSAGKLEQSSTTQS